MGASTFGQRLRYERKQKDLKREELAKIAGVSPRLITFWETDEREPNLKALVALADFFDISLDYLTCRTNVKEWNPPLKQ